MGYSLTSDLPNCLLPSWVLQDTISLALTRSPPRITFLTFSPKVSCYPRFWSCQGSLNQTNGHLMNELNKRKDRRAPLAPKNAYLSKLLAYRKRLPVMPPCFQVASLALLCYTHSEPASRGSHDAGARAKQALHHGRSQATASSPSSVNIGSVKRWALSDFWWCMHSGTCLKPCKWSALLGVARYPDGRGQRSLRFVFLTASCSHLAASLSLQKPGTSVSLLWAIQSEASSKVSPIITALINAVAPPARWRPAMQCVTMTSPQHKDCRTSGHSSFQAAILDQYLSEPKLALILPYLTNHQGMTTVHPGLPNTRQSYIYIYCISMYLLQTNPHSY